MNNKTVQTPQEMQEKINSFRKTVLSDDTKEKTYSHSWNVIIIVLSDLLSGLLVGAGIGFLLYKFFDLHVFIIAFFVLFGGFAGFLNVYKSLNSLQKQ